MHWSVTVAEQRGYSACAAGAGAAAIGAIVGAGAGMAASGTAGAAGAAGAAGIAGSAGAAGISPVGGVSGAGMAGGAGSVGGVACAKAAPLSIKAAVKAKIFIARLLVLPRHCAGEGRTLRSRNGFSGRGAARTLYRLKPSIGVQRIARRAHRADDVGLTAFIDRFAETADVDVHRSWLDVAVMTPDTVEKTFPREHMRGMF